MMHTFAALLLASQLLYAASSQDFIGVPLKKIVDATGARILQVAVNNRLVTQNISTKFLTTMDETRVLAEEYKDDKYLQYYTRIEIGSPVQRFDVTINPAVALTLIPGTKLRKHCRRGGRAFDELSSHSFHSLGETVTSSDGNQSETVNVVKDLFHIGKLPVMDQTFGLILKGHCDKNALYDGVIGLGFSTNYLTLLDNMLHQNIVNQSIVGLYLDRDVKTIRGGEVALGYWNSKYIAANKSFEYIPIIESIVSAWQIHIQLAFIGNNQVTFDRYAVIDTKAYFIDIPWFEAEIFANTIGAYNYKGNLIVNCDNVSKLPDLVISIRQMNFILHGNDYVDTVNSYKNYCMVLIRSTTDDVWTLGGAFLGKYYTIFNYDRKMVAFAELIPPKNGGANNFSYTALCPVLLLLVLKIRTIIY